MQHTPYEFITESTASIQPYFNVVYYVQVGSDDDFTFCDQNLWNIVTYMYYSNDPVPLSIVAQK